ncbi:MAG: glycerophosphodiester phosphodiesterase [Lachnospiraceae bacterium]|nr:glycerophosphodiester phosphodiesterase [Lachnospiraceae bacterium]
MTVLYVILIVIAVLIILYLLSIMPRMIGRPSYEPFKGVYYAHRGLHDNASEAPENSLAAFKKAVRTGFGIELDVQLSKDGVPVIMHDYTLERMCRREGKVCDYTWEELKTFRLLDSEETVPCLEDVLNVVKGKVPLIVELKVEWMDLSVCPVVDAMLRKYQGVYCIESFNPTVLTWYRRYHNDVMRGQLASAYLRENEQKGFLYFCLGNLMMNWTTKPDFIAYNHQYAGNLSRRLCRGLYKNLAVAWTIKSEEELEKAKKSFDVIIFDSFMPKDGKNRIKTNKNRKK